MPTSGINIETTDREKPNILYSAGEIRGDILQSL